MKQIIAGLLAFALIVLRGDVWIGGRDTVSYAIANGAEAAPPHQFPWMVGLKDGASFFCNGVIIDPLTVLTTASCLIYRLGSDVTVVAGAHNILNPEATAVTRVSRHNFAIHEGFDALTEDNDIALIHLAEPLPFNQYIQLVTFDTAGHDWAGQGARLMAWGATDASGSIGPNLNYVDVPVMTNQGCTNVYGSMITDHVGCTNGAGDRGSCLGDRGGAVLVDNTLIGLIAFGASTVCDWGYPTGFTRLGQYLDWIAYHR